MYYVRSHHVSYAHRMWNKGLEILIALSFGYVCQAVVQIVFNALGLESESALTTWAVVLIIAILLYLIFGSGFTHVTHYLAEHEKQLLAGSSSSDPKQPSTASRFVYYPDDRHPLVPSSHHVVPDRNVHCFL